jgi:hypothetical protein
MRRIEQRIRGLQDRARSQERDIQQKEAKLGLLYEDLHSKGFESTDGLKAQIDELEDEVDNMKRALQDELDRIDEEYEQFV